MTDAGAPAPASSMADAGVPATASSMADAGVPAAAAPLAPLAPLAPWAPSTPSAPAGQPSSPAAASVSSTPPAPALRAALLPHGDPRTAASPGDPWYLCYFIHRLLDFRLPDVEAVAETCGAAAPTLTWRMPFGDEPMSPFYYLRVPGGDAVVEGIARRTTLARVSAQGRQGRVIPRHATSRRTHTRACTHARVRMHAHAHTHVNICVQLNVHAHAHIPRFTPTLHTFDSEIPVEGYRSQVLHGRPNHCTATKSHGGHSSSSCQGCHIPPGITLPARVITHLNRNHISYQRPHA
eukprot:355182-Chlamydomonas_euryale.AAC.6